MNPHIERADKILRTIDEHLAEEDCCHKLKEIMLEAFKKWVQKSKFVWKYSEMHSMMKIGKRW